ncbi:putative P-loop containing nucleoside triphosphate hydrolase, leucine-rich repeat domain superfamily [Helianthus annuus]|uniref:P-loop containing nucleoside triphosphate hydrolase, leucine-rich repeat domain superfamily n=1 Tax=Helianthus annuus TaxID=4232 RepID=A0A251RQ24_HELAN|nr:putative P-loop containing nucleoside triphosphate hydrolase, leucine-rich repeat domain superfamily [Helianthus annuus]KAJ0429320.1 putative P-loop containing nucleoside triphosphate hydrolase, leucine-rich repeat domain superfamily [Helianthus annuus]KAJ0636502.1 putative P-loop containing nucleoside triphosphate hydrolase, leucine-rich repeat domain superfamily [Helianthus annuus]
MQIARYCRGLPLAVVVIAGVLAKEPVIKEAWERISQSGSSLIFKGHMETLALSLNHLPSHLRNCFLYLGGFPEDYRFHVARLIWLWIAEGFIQEFENQSLEETAKDYLMELVDRNHVVVQDRKFDRAIKTFSVHDVLRELSSEIATKERFNIEVLRWGNRIIAPYKTSRLFICPTIEYFYESYIVLKCSHSWRLLTVLGLRECHLNYFPEEISLLVNIRYLAIQNDFREFPSTICILRSLQTLIIEGWISDGPLVLPNTISNLVNLRHLQCRRAIVFPPLQMPFENLQTISSVVLGHEPTSWVNYFSGVKKLSCCLRRQEI